MARATGLMRNGDACLIDTRFWGVARARVLGFLATAMTVAGLSLSCCTKARADQGCDPAITTAEQQNNILPAHILHAIGVVESGRRDPMTGEFGAWPWSVNAAGDSRSFATRDQAIAFVRDAQARGIRSIDVGCMQINLLYHPNAFTSLEEAFTPETNVRYAASFLMDLRQRAGDWEAATGDYHSATPGLSENYARRVQAVLHGGPPAGDLLMRASPLSSAEPAGFASRVVLLGPAARRVQVIGPATTPVGVSLLRGAHILPRVYSP